MKFVYFIYLKKIGQRLLTRKKKKNCHTCWYVLKQRNPAILQETSVTGKDDTEDYVTD